MKSIRTVLHHLAACTVFCASFGTPQAFAAVTLHADIETINTAKNEGGKTPANSSRSLDVILDDNYIEVKSANAIQIYDLNKRRRIDIETKSKTYVDYSLYDVVGYRAAEFQNRETMRTAMLTAKIAQEPIDTVENEHLLSVQSNNPVKLQATQSDGDTIFTTGSHQLARFTQHGIAVSEKDSENFAKFLRYDTGIHPQILADLAASKQIPQKLAFNFKQFWGSIDRTITIRDVQQIASVPYDLSAYSKRKPTHSQNAFDDITDQANTLNAGDMEKAKAANQAQRDSDAKQGQILDYFLGFIEMNLMTGEAMPSIPPEMLEKIRGDADIQSMNAAISAQSKDALPQAVSTLAAMREKAPHKAYMLKLFEANQRVRMGDKAGASKLFAEVLQANPCLAGAYKDTGDFMIISFDTPRAWLFWDAGRKLSPTFKNFNVVTQFENNLAKQYPEYF